MENLTRLLELLPELTAAGLLDAGGGSIAVRTSRGIVVSPTQASRSLRWGLTADDFVLFPGDGPASMARAGRQPSRENKLHRAVLAARPDWHCTLLGQGWGLLGHALAGAELRVPEAHAWPIDRNKAVTIPVVDGLAGSDELIAAVVATLEHGFARRELGAVLIRDYGPFIAGAELEATLSLAQSLETLARARHWQLRG